MFIELGTHDCIFLFFWYTPIESISWMSYPGVWAAVLSCWHPEFLSTVYRALMKRLPKHLGHLVYPNHRGASLLWAVPLLLLLSEGLMLPTCCSLELNFLYIHKGEAPSSSGVQFFWYKGASHAMVTSFIIDSSRNLSPGVYHVSSNKELYFHHRFLTLGCWHCGRELVQWETDGIMVKSMAPDCSALNPISSTYYLHNLGQVTSVLCNSVS